jgi:hypothetical protein
MDDALHICVELQPRNERLISFKVKGHSGGKAISGADSADRFTIGLLRASVDAVMVERPHRS